MRKNSFWQKIVLKLTTGFLAIISLLTLGKWVKKHYSFFPKEVKNPINNEEVVSHHYHHEHVFSDWQVQDDYLEERVCSCGYKETREHLYNVFTRYVADGEYSHHVLKTYICPNCHNCFKIYEKEKCSFEQDECPKCNYSYIMEENHIHSWDKYYYDSDLEYFKCSTCGAVKTKIHRFQIKEKDGILIYTCYNNNCPYSFKENANHQHIYGLSTSDNYNDYFICSCGAELVIPKDVEIYKDFERGIVLSRTKK